MAYRALTNFVFKQDNAYKAEKKITERSNFLAKHLNNVLNHSFYSQLSNNVIDRNFLTKLNQVIDNLILEGK